MIAQRSVVSAAVLFLFALGAAPAPDPAQDVKWRSDYGAALREAAESKRPVVLILSTDYCGWCRQLESTTLRSPDVVARLNERCVPIKLAGDDPANAYLVSGLRIQGYPALVTISSAKRVVETQEGYLDATNFLAMLQRATVAESPAAAK